MVSYNIHVIAEYNLAGSILTQWAQVHLLNVFKHWLPMLSKPYSQAALMLDSGRFKLQANTDKIYIM